MKKVIALLYVAFAVVVAFPQMAFATITGSFTTAPPAYFVPPGGTTFFGQPAAAPGFPGGGLATSITTTATTPTTTSTMTMFMARRIEVFAPQGARKIRYLPRRAQK